MTTDYICNPENMELRLKKHMSKIQDVYKRQDKLCGSTDNPEDKIQEMVSWMTGTANEELGKLKFKGHKTPVSYTHLWGKTGWKINTYQT